MGCFHVHNFCCCVSLQTGAKVLGFLTLIGCSLDILAFSLIFHYEGRSQDPGRYETPFTLCTVIFTNLILVVTSILLIMAVYQEKPKFIPFWLINIVFAVMFQTALTFLPPLLGPYTLQENDLIAVIVCVPLYSYGWLVVYSYYLTVGPQSASMA